MYQFSRSLYRQLAEGVVPSRGEDVAITRQHFLRSCEISMERLALDRHYFAKPVKTLFNDVRVPLPGRKYCPSHKHLEGVVAVATA